VTIDDPPNMNVLGLFLASSLRRNLVEKGRPCSLRGAMTVDADGMRATVRFDESGVRVTREPTDATVEVKGPLAVLTSALVERRLMTLLKVRIKGSPLFAWRALKVMRP
jgi:hypothetical protein